MVCNVDEDASCPGSGKDGVRFESGTITSRLISRTLLPLNNVAEVSLEWSLAKPSKYIVCLGVALVVLFGASVSLNMFLFRRVSALESEMDTIRHLVDDLVVATSLASEETPVDDLPVSLADPSDVIETESLVVREKRQALALPSSSSSSPAAQQKRNDRRTRRKRAGAANAGVRGAQFRPCLKAVLKSDSSGLVTGWHPDWAADPFRYQFDALRSQITIKEDGLYFVYSQLYFFHSFEVSGYEVFLSRSDTALAEKPSVIAKCSLTGSHPGATADTGERSEASCYTSAVVPLSRGDSIFIRVRELERYLNLARGHSYMGLVKLGRHPGKKRNRRGHALNDPQCPAN